MKHLLEFMDFDDCVLFIFYFFLLCLVFGIADFLQEKFKLFDRKRKW